MREHIKDWTGFDSFAYSNEVWISNQDKSLFLRFFPHKAVECRSCTQAEQVASAIVFAVENKGLVISRHFAKFDMQTRYTMDNKTISGDKECPNELMNFLGVKLF